MQHSREGFEQHHRQKCIVSRKTQIIYRRLDAGPLWFLTLKEGPRASILHVCGKLFILELKLVLESGVFKFLHPGKTENNRIQSGN